MKQCMILIFAGVILMMPEVLMSQYQYELMKMSEGVHNGLWFTVGAEDEKEVEGVWRDFMKERSLKVKRNRKPREYRAEDVKGTEVSTLFGTTMYMQTQEMDTAIRVNIWVQQGEDFPDFWDDEQAQGELETLLDHFRLALRQFQAEQALEEAENELKDMERSLSRLESRKENYEKRIEKAYKEIEENEQNILDNTEEQEALKKELKAQRERVSERQVARDRLQASSSPKG